MKTSILDRPKAFSADVLEVRNTGSYSFSFAKINIYKAEDPCKRVQAVM